MYPKMNQNEPLLQKQLPVVLCLGGAHFKYLVSSSLEDFSQCCTYFEKCDMGNAPLHNLMSVVLEKIVTYSPDILVLDTVPQALLSMCMTENNFSIDRYIENLQNILHSIYFKFPEMQIILLGLMPHALQKVLTLTAEGCKETDYIEACFETFRNRTIHLISNCESNAKFQRLTSVDASSQLSFGTKGPVHWTDKFSGSEKRIIERTFVNNLEQNIRETLYSLMQRALAEDKTKQIDVCHSDLCLDEHCWPELAKSPAQNKQLPLPIKTATTNCAVTENTLTQVNQNEHFPSASKSHQQAVHLFDCDTDICEEQEVSDCPLDCNPINIRTSYCDTLKETIKTKSISTPFSLQSRTNHIQTKLKYRPVYNMGQQGAKYRATKPYEIKRPVIAPNYGTRSCKTNSNHENRSTVVQEKNTTMKHSKSNAKDNSNKGKACTSDINIQNYNPYCALEVYGVHEDDENDQFEIDVNVPEPHKSASSNAQTNLRNTISSKTIRQFFKKHRKNTTLCMSTAEEPVNSKKSTQEIVDKDQYKLQIFNFKILVGHLKTELVQSEKSHLFVNEILQKLDKKYQIISQRKILCNGQPVLSKNFVVHYTDQLELLHDGLGGGKIKGQDYQVHPEKGNCGPCCLCGRKDGRFIHLKTKIESDSKFVDLVQENKHIGLTDCICRKCETRLRREYPKENITDSPTCKAPEDKKVKLDNSVSKCLLYNFNKCSAPCDANLRKLNGSIDTALTTFGIGGAHNFKPEDNLMLCFDHHTQLFNELKKSQHECQLCSKHFDDLHLRGMPDISIYFFKCFLQSESINKDKIATLDITGQVCVACVTRLSRYTLKTYGVKNISLFSKSYLQSVLEKHDQTEVSTETLDDCNQVALNRTIQYVGNLFLNGSATLLTSVYKFYCKTLLNFGSVLGTCNIATHSELHVKDFLKSTFGDSLQLHDCYGTIVMYWLGQNILDVLGQVLLESSNCKCEEKSLELQSVKDKLERLNISSDAEKNLSLSKDTTDQNVAMLNKFRKNVKSMIKKIISADRNNTLNMSCLNFQDFAQKFIDPTLYNLLDVFSMTDQEYKCADMSSILTKDPSFASDKKFLNKMFIISCINFLNSSECKYPFHLLLCDILDKYTKSSDQCQQIFNNLGISSSSSTLARHIVDTVEKRLINGVNSEFTPNTFRVASLDNINARSPYAFVKSNNLKRGLDDTSIMACEPKPSLKLFNSELGQFHNKVITSEDNETFIFSTVLKNTNAFYRSIVMLCDVNLRVCKRDENGMPIDSDLYNKENKLLDIMKGIVLQNITDAPDYFRNIGKTYVNIPLLLKGLHDIESQVNLNQISDVLPDISEYLSFIHLSGCHIKFYMKVDDNLSPVLSIGTVVNTSSTTTFNLCIEKLECDFCIQPLVDDNMYTRETLFDDRRKFALLQSINCIKPESTVQSHQSLLGTMPFHVVSCISDIEPSTSSNTVCNPKPNKKKSLDQSLLEKKKCEIFAQNLKQIKEKITVNDIIDPITSEINASSDLKYKLFAYCFAKQGVHEKLCDTFACLKVFMSKPYPPETEKSNVYYIDILNENADSKETVYSVLCQLFKTMGVGISVNYVIVVGDGKTYDHLVKLKSEFPKKLDWMLPFPGDWHLLKNYASALFKVYGPAGLDSLVTLFHKGAVGASVLSGTNFERTLNFLLQVWEAMYRFEIAQFISFNNGHEEGMDSQEATTNLSYDNVVDVMQKWITCNRTEQRSNESLCQDIINLISIIGPIQDKFVMFAEKMCSENETFQFWHKFIHEDCFAYISLYLAIRSGNWNLRNFSLKLMVPLFHVTGSTYYYKLLPYHLASLQWFPQSVIDHFESGGFVLNILGNNWSSVALDEGHECLINKDVKGALTSLSHTSVSTCLHYLPFRAQTFHNLMNQLFPLKSAVNQKEDSEHFIKQSEGNVLSYMSKMKEPTCMLFRCELNISKPLVHIFKGNVAENLVSQDLMNFTLYGQNSLKDHIEFFLLGNAKEMAKPKRHAKLHNFGDTSKKKPKDLVTENLATDVILLKKRVEWITQHGHDAGQSISNIRPIPLALCDAGGLPFKGTKAKVANFYKKEFASSFHSKLENIDIDCVIIDAMFAVNKPPPDHLKTFGQYATYFYDKWVSHIFLHEQMTPKEVHLVFDCQNSKIPSPKQFERFKRDTSANGGLLSSTYNTLETDTLLPSNWAAFLKDRKHKKLIIDFLGQVLLELSASNLSCDQSLFVNISKDIDINAVYVASSKSIIQADALFNNHLEGDSMVWLHAVKSTCRNILVYSFDTDVYHIGLPIAALAGDKKLYVQIQSAYNANVYIDVKSLLQNMNNKFVYNKFDEENVAKIMMMLFICTGCDYVSFFKHHGKNSFLDTFFKNIDFILSTNVLPGHRFKDHCTGNFGDFSFDNASFESFLRLIGCEYFRHCKKFFASSATCPSDLYMKIFDTALSNFENVTKWLEKIRDATIFTFSTEDNYLPSLDSLKYHWLRCCWVAKVWIQSSVSLMAYPDLSKHGWNLSDENILTIQWESQSNIDKTNQYVHFWMKGCSCTKLCKSVCGCKRKNSTCGPGCRCKAVCYNAPPEISTFDSTSLNMVNINDAGSDSDNTDEAPSSHPCSSSESETSSEDE